MIHFLKKTFLIGLILSILFFISIWLFNHYINQSTSEYIYSNPQEVPSVYTALVLGSYVDKNGNLSSILRERADAALLLYQEGKIKRFLLSGDHGRKNYDEVNGMKKYLLAKGIAQQDIFLDHAGFDTYNSIVRAKEIFEVKDMIVISQAFHLPRALYIAHEKGMNAYGFNADQRKNVQSNYLKFREMFACLKAFIEIAINRKPQYLGDKIPITGNSELSYD